MRYAPRGGPPGPAGRVLLLTPSRGLGGGIERCVQTLEWAFGALGLACERRDLARPGPAAHGRLLAAGRAVLRAGPQPTRLVVGHRALLPVAALLAREPAAAGISVLCHGSDCWDAWLRPRRLAERRLLRRPGVRAVAVSSFTAGALAADRPATVLPPALCPSWFGTLVRAAEGARGPAGGIRIVTVFRLADWRDKGLPELARAVLALRRADVSLAVCGGGAPPPGLRQFVNGLPWCELRPGLSDADLAGELATASLFVLATRTRTGRRGCGEGFGLALLEAQVAGTAVVAPAHGGAHDAYVEGLTGLSPADESPEALTRVLRSLLADPAHLARMGARAARWAREAFDPGRYPDLVARRLL